VDLGQHLDLAGRTAGVGMVGGALSRRGGVVVVGVAV